MDLQEAITGRRSIRCYNDILVGSEEIQAIIEAGMWAPSACDLQQWKFIVIDKKEIFEDLYKMGAASFVRKTKQAILVVYNNQTDNTEYNDYIQSASAAIENMLLKAYSIGVGTCWVNNLPNKKALRKYMDIPSYYDPIALVTIGHYSQQINKRKRKYDLNSLISYNHFDFEGNLSKARYKIVIKRFARKVYKCLPFKPFLLKFIGKLEKKFDN